MEYLPYDVLLYEVLPLIGRKDLVSFKRCNRWTHNLTTRNNLYTIWRKKVELYLQEIFQEDIIHLFNFLEHSGAAISGSTILQAILGEYYPNSDIDFICPGDKIFIRDFCEKLTAPLVLVADNEYKDLEATTDDDSYKDQVNENNILIDEIYESNYVNRLQKTKLQFITTRLTTRQHVSNYDFNLVQNLYSRKTGQSTLWIGDDAAILNKEICVIVSSNNYISRISRYFGRGYKLLSPSVNDDVKILRELLACDRKYRGRIFATVITNQKQWSQYNEEDLHVCRKEFDCFLDHFQRSYKHKHVLPNLAKEIRNGYARKLHKKCSEIVLELPKWSHNEGLWIYNEITIPPKAHIAAFDLIDTLITIKSKNKCFLTPDDWNWKYKNTKDEVRSLLNSGYFVVIITNQYIPHNPKSEYTRLIITAVVDEIIKFSDNNNITVFVATDVDKWRKPHSSIWDTYLEHSDKAESVYVSSSVGRKSDDSDIDSKFADNIGIDISFPEMFFQGKEREDYKWPKNKSEYFKPTKYLQGIENSQFDLPLLKAPYVVIMMGPPVSGKSYFVRKYLTNSSVVSADLTTEKKAMKLYKYYLEKKVNITIDDMNPTRFKRLEYAKLGKNKGYNIYCFAMNVDEQMARHLNYYQTVLTNKSVHHNTFRAYFNKRESPKEDERCVKVPFIPNFTPEEKRIFLQYSE